MDASQYLSELKNKLLDKNNWAKVTMTREWASEIPSEAGVYAFKEKGNIVYVGETGNLRGRMNDLLDSRHHTLRRTIGQRLFSHERDFIQATTKVKFPDHIEVLVNNHICNNLFLAFIPVKLGRKELEELIEEAIDREIRLISVEKENQNK